MTDTTNHDDMDCRTRAGCARHFRDAYDSAQRILGPVEARRIAMEELGIDEPGDKSRAQLAWPEWGMNVRFDDDGLLASEEGDPNVVDIAIDAFFDVVRFVEMRTLRERIAAARDEGRREGWTVAMERAWKIVDQSLTLFQARAAIFDEEHPSDWPTPPNRLARIAEALGCEATLVAIVVEAKMLRVLVPALEETIAQLRAELASARIEAETNATVLRDTRIALGVHEGASIVEHVEAHLAAKPRPFPAELRKRIDAWARHNDLGGLLESQVIVRDVHAWLTSQPVETREEQSAEEIKEKLDVPAWVAELIASSRRSTKTAPTKVFNDSAVVWLADDREKLLASTERAWSSERVMAAKYHDERAKTDVEACLRAVEEWRRQRNEARAMARPVETRTYEQAIEDAATLVDEMKRRATFTTDAGTLHALIDQHVTANAIRALGRKS